ncbi:MAG: class I SAM-dependent methyltransferase [Bacteroidota bacterium]
MRKLTRFLDGLCGFIYNFFICYFVDRPRRVAFVNSVLSFQKRQQLSKIFPSVEFTEIFPATEPLRITFEKYSYRGGNVSFSELALLAAIVKSTKPRAIFEFGTYNGNTTLQLALNAPEDTLVYTLDLPSTNPGTRLRLDSGERLLVDSARVGERFVGTNAEKKIRQILMDSAVYDYSALRGKIDMIFIDGSHSYEYVQNDTRRALEMCAPNGLILWHDYMIWNDVTDYLNNLSRTLPLRHMRGTSLVAYKAP